MINGLSWPSTERLTYRLGDPVRWRVINLSSQIHPMHLHGFYYRVSGSATACATRPSPAARAAASSRRWCRRAAR